MTSVLADSFPLSNEHPHSSDSQDNVSSQSEIQLAKLLRTSHLTDWKTGKADIQLSPSSCLDNYLNLVIRGNPLELLPAEAAPNAGLVNVPSSALATHHQAGKLALRCRKLEVETSASQQPAQYKLYMAAGFVVHKVDGQTQRAPILLIPVTIGRLRGRGSNYVIRYCQGDTLRLNPGVAELCNTHVDQVIKPFTKTADLRDYLRSMNRKLQGDLECRISANTGILSLQSDVLGDFTLEDQLDFDLDRTKPGIDFQPLPVVPEAFNASLALRILRYVKHEDLTDALYNFSGQQPQTFTPIADVEPNLDDATLEKYYDCAGWLVDVGLGHWKLKNIAKLPDRITRMTADLEQLNNSSSFIKYFKDEFRTIDILFRLNRIKDKISHAPLEMQHHASSEHANANTRLLLQKAKIQASALEQEMAVIHETFHLSSVPSSNALHHLIKTIAMREQESQLTNPNYFRARRQLNEILKTHNGVVTDNDLASLERLAKTLKFSELFREDPYYKRYFGSLFKGRDTNWQRLDSVVDYTRSLAQHLGSSLLVAQFAAQWTSFQRDFPAIAQNLESAASSAHGLCSLVPMYINQTTHIEHAVRTAEKLKIRVDQWQKYMHKHFADTELTPYQLLSNVELDEHNHPAVALPQQEFDRRIYQHIVGTGLDTEHVSATAEWLINVVDRLQIDIPTVTRFLDKEAELAIKLGNS